MLGTFPSGSRFASDQLGLLPSLVFTSHFQQQRTMPGQHFGWDRFFSRLFIRIEPVHIETCLDKDGPGRSGKRQSPGLGFHCFRYMATSLLKQKCRKL